MDVKQIVQRRKGNGSLFEAVDEARQVVRLLAVQGYAVHQFHHQRRFYYRTEQPAARLQVHAFAQGRMAK